MTKTLAYTDMGEGLLITFTRSDTLPGEPSTQHALVLVSWSRVEELLEAVAPRNRHRGGRPRGRHVPVNAAVSKTWWEWAASERVQRDGGSFEPITSSFRSESVFVVNAPLMAEDAESEVSVILNGPGAGEAIYIVLSPNEIQDLMLCVTVLWAEHVDGNAPD
ncbi:hypothetical protein ACOCJ4_05590 [Knoellia sp. CPCC 206435]|uniref:hypothetical protein n=1 Tax=Knoellia terrae TaxID=3404797 RepID=UPI003B4328AA